MTFDLRENDQHDTEGYITKIQYAKRDLISRLAYKLNLSVYEVWSDLEQYGVDFLENSFANREILTR